MKKVNVMFKNVLILVASFIIVTGVLWAAFQFLKGLDDTIAALLAFVGAVLVAIINNNFIRRNQIESEERISQAKISEEIRKEKQQNYLELLSLIGRYIRKPNSSNDEFINVHIKTWVYGSQEIISKTAELVRINRSNDLDNFDKTLEELIRLIRAETGLTKLNSELKIVSPFVKQEIRGTNFE